MSNCKKTILYIGNFMFPLNNAAGKRVYSNCCILRDLGYRVICIGNNRIEKNLLEKKDCYIFDGIESYSFKYCNGRKRLEYWKYFDNIIRLIYELEIEDDIKAIFVYANLSITFLNLKLRKWSKKRKIMCYSDCTDWFDPPKGKIFLKIWKKIDTELQMRIFNQTVDGLVCISSYLSKYYHNKHTVIIPPLTNSNLNRGLQRINKLTDQETVNFVYAGSKFRKGKPVDPKYWKDRLDLMIEGFYKAKKADMNIKFTFSIIGITEEEFINHLPTKKRKEFEKKILYLTDELYFCDFLPQKTVEQKISEADFSVLIRDKKRMTMVGFPTKISESISCGTPVIYNDTSDIRCFVGNGDFGYLVDKNTLHETIIKIAHMSREEINALKCRCYYDNPFNYKLFLSDMKSFLEVKI